MSDNLVGNVLDTILCVCILIFIWTNWQAISCFTSRAQRDIMDITGGYNDWEGHKQEPKLPNIYIEHFEGGRELEDSIGEGNMEISNDRFGQVNGKANIIDDKELLQLIYNRSLDLGEQDEYELELLMNSEREKEYTANGMNDINSKILQKNKKMQMMSRMNDDYAMRSNRSCVRDDLQMDYENHEAGVEPWWS